MGIGQLTTLKNVIMAGAKWRECQKGLPGQSLWSDAAKGIKVKKGRA